MAVEADKLHWEAQEYDHEPKTKDWFWALGIITVSIAIVSFLYDNLLFSILIIVAALAMGLHANHKPKRVYFEINKKGIAIDDRFFAFNSIKSFWIEDNGYERPKILIRSQKFSMPFIIIPTAPFDAAKPDIIRDFLLNYIVEEEMHEPMSQKVMEYLGF